MQQYNEESITFSHTDRTHTVKVRRRVMEIVSIVSEPNTTPIKRRHAIHNDDELASLALAIFDEIGDNLQEHMVAIFLNTGNHLIGWKKVSTGSLDSTIFPVNAILRAAILSGCKSLALVHNHPSGNTTPSQEDHSCTIRLARAAEYMDITLHDHIIISTELRTHTSLRAEGCL